MTAARDYKAIIAGITSAADELRERDRERAVELSRDLVGLDDAMVRAEERAALTRLGVHLHWEAALETLWAESWMTLRPMPAPDERVDPAHIDALDAAVEQRFIELRDATRRRGFGLRRR
ncbi:hypothetical protein [Pseudonocardia acidicola]|uniref:DUF222 domain-containing protein n=1 Tax=Pseudonocardia acidicola TaxID=2724939 RepID=A0ABX1S6K7_9PSEU|nr:hypothetical protein [Pseudonocardia acidicola]NMH97195.1 hypothetical protein [Pseudonocardia acidicola]